MFESLGATVGGIFAVIVLLLTLAVHVGFAAAVFYDADRLKQAGEETVFAPPPLWAAATLLGGVFAAAVYWLIHHSTLSRR